MQTKPKYQLKSFNRLIKFAGLAITFFVLLTSNCFGQSITWQRILQGPFANANDFGYASCRADGDNIYIVGSISNQRIYLLKLNQFGDTVWTRIIGNSYSRGRAIVECDTGSCVLTGNIENGQAFAIKVDKNGNILWQKYYGGNQVQLNDIKKSHDGGYLLCGSEYPLNAVALKINSTGNLIWRNTYVAGYKINFQSVIEKNNEFIFTGWKSDNSNLPTNCLIFKTDMNGKYIWDTIFNINSYHTGGNKVIDINNGFGIAGNYNITNIFFIRTDYNGKINFIKLFDTTYQKFDIGNIVMLNSNKYIMNYSQDSITGQIDGKIAIFDSLGNIKQYKTYTSVRQLTFSSITQLADTGFIFCGTINNYASTFKDIYVIKSDTLLYSTPIGLISYSNTIPEQTLLQQNYPNPFNPETIIRINLDKTKSAKLIIYDITGKKIETLIDKFLQAGKYDLKWHPRTLSSGIYFACLFINNSLINSIKIIFIK